MQAESPITVACIQMEPKIGEKKANVAHSLDKIAEAAGKGARLIVLPELAIPAMSLHRGTRLSRWPSRLSLSETQSG